MREIPLSQGHVALVDDADYVRVMSAGPWSVSIKPTTSVLYALRGVKKPDGSWTTDRLHNFITGQQFVDHRNGDGLDNRRANLRAADKSGNGANRPAPLTNRSGYKGVCWHKGGGKWMAQLTYRGKRIYLGLHADPTDAAAAYDAAALELFGEFARPNFPQEQSA